jgi:transcriptional regulator with XRE-family HTH domain
MGRADSKSLRATFAKNIRRIRNSLELSQEALADVAGLHRTYIGSIERQERNVSIDNIEKIAAALKVKADTLLRDGRE